MHGITGSYLSEHQERTSATTERDFHSSLDRNVALPANASKSHALDFKSALRYRNAPNRQELQIEYKQNTDISRSCVAGHNAGSYIATQTGVHRPNDLHFALLLSIHQSSLKPI